MVAEQGLVTAIEKNAFEADLLSVRPPVNADSLATRKPKLQPIA